MIVYDEVIHNAMHDGWEREHLQLSEAKKGSFFNCVKSLFFLDVRIEQSVRAYVPFTFLLHIGVGWCLKTVYGIGVRTCEACVERLGPTS